MNNFKSNAKGKLLERAKKSYISLVTLLEQNNHALLSEYINNATKVLINFNCSHEPHWIRPNTYKSGHGCPKCVSQEKINKAKQDFLKRLEKNNHILKSMYINTETKVLINFNCGHEPHWITPNNYKKGHGCPKCVGLCKEKARIQFVNLLKQNNHTLISNYSNNKTKVLIGFNCGHDPHWVTPNSYKNGSRCPKCTRNSSEQAKEELINLLKENNHTLLSGYINSKTKVLIDFNCGHKPHWITPNNYKKHSKCPLCKKHNTLIKNTKQ